MVQRAKSTTTVVGELQAFYANKKLLVDHFDCPHSDACRQDAQCELRRGAEAHVGTLYGERLRVVVVSNALRMDGGTAELGAGVASGSR